METVLKTFNLYDFRPLFIFPFLILTQMTLQLNQIRVDFFSFLILAWQGFHFSFEFSLYFLENFIKLVCKNKRVYEFRDQILQPK